MKLKEFGPSGGEGGASKILLCRSATALDLKRSESAIDFAEENDCVDTVNAVSTLDLAAISRPRKLRFHDHGSMDTDCNIRPVLQCGNYD